MYYMYVYILYCILERIAESLIYILLNTYLLCVGLYISLEQDAFP